MSATTITPAAPRRPRLGRTRATAYSLAYLLLSVPVLALFVIQVVAIPLVIVTAGIGLLLLAVPAAGGIARLHCRMAERILGEEVIAEYASTEGMTIFARLLAWARDPARWRVLLWMLVNSVAGFVLALLPIVFFLSIIFHLIYPFLFWVTPDGVFDQNLGLFKIDTQAESFLEWSFAVVSALLWWYAGPALVRAHAAMDRNLLAHGRTQQLERRVQNLAQSRAQSVDFSAAELRRIERDLHDGAQARLVSLGMSLGMADELMETDPEAARKLLSEARTTSSAALGDLRSVVRGMHPPVLADRGLAGAVQALAMDLSIPVMLTVELYGRPPAPVESAVYFATAECLANVVKHSGAARAWVSLSHAAGVLRVEIGDDGHGGARPDAGTGMLGVMRRLSAFDGTMSVSSPAGGPTVVVLEVPCELAAPPR